MPAFNNSFIPTLKLEQGMCFTVLKNVCENELPALTEKLDFTIWSPECYLAAPSFPSDILAYSQGEMRIYHASEQKQLDKLFSPEQEKIRICGYRPRSSHPFQLNGISFTEDLPADLIDVPHGILELTCYALDDLCGIIYDLQTYSSLLDSSDHFEELINKTMVTFPRLIKVITNVYDEEIEETFKAQLMKLHCYKDKRRFLKLFYSTFLSTLSPTTPSNEDLFVELMIYRTKLTCLSKQLDPTLNFLKMAKSSFRPLLSSIDIILYKNFIEKFHEDSTNL